MKHQCSIITGSGSYIPTEKVTNRDFLKHDFRDSEGNRIEKTNSQIIEQFEAITGIEERTYVTDDLVTSDIAYFAARDAIRSSGIDKESLDYIIVAHNTGDIKAGNTRSDIVPSLAARVKHKLKIENPYCVPYDLPFGCPGWVQGVIQADYYLRSGDAKKVLVIGAETLSRVVDPHDRDSMLYSDGAGAAIVERVEQDEQVGIISHRTRSDTKDDAFMLWMGNSFNGIGEDQLFLKMQGRKVYEYALKTVAEVVRDSIEKATLYLKDISKVLIHQANAKMDEAILQRLFKLYDQIEIPKNIMPMTIAKLGNNSVATVPILYDLIVKGLLEGQSFNKGDNIVLASVGAGMNINSIVYRVH